MNENIAIWVLSNLARTQLITISPVLVVMCDWWPTSTLRVQTVALSNLEKLNEQNDKMEFDSLLHRPDKSFFINLLKMIGFNTHDPWSQPEYILNYSWLGKYIDVYMLLCYKWIPLGVYCKTGLIHND